LLQLPKKKKRNKKIQFQIRTRRKENEKNNQQQVEDLKHQGALAFFTIVRGRPHSRHLAGPKITTRESRIMQIIHLNQKIQKLSHEKLKLKNWEIGNPGGADGQTGHQNSVPLA
jgi:hypothetical protein